MNKLRALIYLPFMPFMIVIDLLVGDTVTGVKTTPLQKLREHKKLWLALWKARG
jgi:hypothetical protein